MKSPLIYEPGTLITNAQDFFDICQIMAKYYKGVEEAQVHYLDETFHSAWLMRDDDVPEHTHIHVEDKPTFKKRVSLK